MEKRGDATGSKTRSLGGACRRKAGVESQHLVGAYLDRGTGESQATPLHLLP